MNFITIFSKRKNDIKGDWRHECAKCHEAVAGEGGPPKNNP